MKKNSKLKKSIALALIVIFCISLLPLEIFAAETDSIWVGGVELTQSTPYLSVGSTSASAEKPQSGGYAHWDTDTKTLTLNNYTYSGTGYVYGTNNMTGNYEKDVTAVIHTTSDCSILLYGSNSLNNTAKSSDKMLGTGIYADGSNLTVKGTGSLDISANYRGIYLIYASEKVLSFEGGNITLFPTQEDTLEFRGIYTLYGSIIFKNNVNVTVDMKSRKDDSNLGVTVYGSGYNETASTLTITDQSSLTVLGHNKYGIYANVCDTEISKNAQVKVTVEGAPENGFYAKNGALTVKDDAQMNIKVGNNPNKTTSGIYATKDIIISDRSTVSATSEGGQCSYGIWANEALTLSGAPTVTAIAGESTLEQINAGIYAIGAVSIMGGRLNAIGGVSQGSSYGIYAENDIEIGEATVNANGGESKSGGYVRALDNVNLLKIVPNTTIISVFIGDTAADTPLIGSPFSQTVILNRKNVTDTNYEPKKYFLAYPNVHTHTMEYFYTDGSGHWQECSAANCYDENKCKTEISEHDMTDSTCTEAAKCQTEGCNYTAAIDENAHSWNEGVVTVNPTCSAFGVKTFTCAYNNEHTKTEELAIDANAHAHGSTWVSDAIEHWNECECGDKANVAPHADTNNDEKCDVCSYAMPKAPSNNETEKPTDATESEKDDSTETEAPADNGCGGCGSSAALSALAIVAVVGSALVIKKKED